MKYLLWTVGIVAGVAVLLLLLFLGVAALNVIRTMRRYGDLTAMAVHGDQLRTFYHLVEEHFQAKGRPLSIRDGVAYVTAEDGDEPHQMGLQNLSQVLAQTDEKEWPETVARHFDALASAEREQESVLADREDYEKIKQHLAVRLMPREGVPLEHMVWREDLEGVITNLVYDLPSSIRTVHIDDEKRWPVGLTEVFAAALENTKRLTKPEIGEIDVDGTMLKALNGQDSYITTNALWLHEHPEWLGPHGAIVALPHRYALLIYPIHNVTVVTAIQKLIFITIGMEKEGPGSITANIYWYRDGKFVNLPYELKGKELNFHPPDEFVEMLNTLEMPQPG